MYCVGIVECRSGELVPVISKNPSLLQVQSFLLRGVGSMTPQDIPREGETERFVPDGLENERHSPAVSCDAIILNVLYQVYS
jgi:hypothetical protein